MHPVPYTSQFANPAWAEMVIKDDQPISRDIMWEKSGARSIKEYEKWVLSICGMACTVMALQFFKKETYTTIELARDAAKMMVYKKDGDGISAMQYKAFVQWIKKFDLRGTIYTKLTYRSLCYLLARNQLVIVSVNPNIRGDNMVPNTQVGGHLVLLIGYNKKDKTLTFHNPAGYENTQTQSKHTVQYKEYAIYASGRGIGLRNINSN